MARTGGHDPRTRDVNLWDIRSIDLTSAAALTVRFQLDRVKARDWLEKNIHSHLPAVAPVSAKRNHLALCVRNHRRWWSCCIAHSYSFSAPQRLHFPSCYTALMYLWRSLQRPGHALRRRTNDFLSIMGSSHASFVCSCFTQAEVMYAVRPFLLFSIAPFYTCIIRGLF